jgi:hypothetical protein
VALERTVEELLQQVSGSVVLVAVADSGAWPARDRPAVQHLSWQRPVVDHGSTRMIREDALFVLVLTTRKLLACCYRFSHAESETTVTARSKS